MVFKWNEIWNELQMYWVKNVHNLAIPLNFNKLWGMLMTKHIHKMIIFSNMVQLWDAHLS